MFAVKKKIRNQERLASIVNFRRQGLTLHEIGLKYGLTRERVRQILDSVSEPKPQIKRKTTVPRTRKKTKWAALITALEVGESFLYDGNISYSLPSNVKTAAKKLGRKVQVYKFHSGRIRVTRFD